MVRAENDSVDAHMTRELICYRPPSGEVWCWGMNTYAQLGNNPNNNSPVWSNMGAPVRVLKQNGQPLSNVRDLAVGADHGCAVTNDERIFCWGSSWWGQRGINRPAQGQAAPGYANELQHNVTQPIRGIAASTWARPTTGTSCIIDGNDNTQCWGWLIRPYDDWPGISLINLGRDPNGTILAASVTPRPVTGMGNAHRLTLSRNDLCVRQRDGTQRCRGVNLKGALGIESTERTDFSHFSVTRTLLNWGNSVDVLNHADMTGCSRQTDASVRCAGWKYAGRLGNDYMPNPSGGPVQPLGLDPVRQVSVGHQTVCVLQASGRLKCWGSNDYGTMGLGHRNGSGNCWANSSGSINQVVDDDGDQGYLIGMKCYQVPQEGSIPEGTVYLASGMASLCGVTGNGRVWCRGLITSNGVNTNPNFEFDRWLNVPAP
jgi:alpha-tubulin suppressor-like RCC1 family protein